jgi:sugar phosphate isomerase/epimerase
MRILMHTMATPVLPPRAAADFAASLGFDGIELVIQDGYRCGLPADAPLADAAALGRAARDAGAPIVAVTPYARAFNAAEAERRDSAIAETKHAIRLAAVLGAGAVRILAGEPTGDEAALQRLADAIRQLACAADGEGVDLNIENHDGTMADSAARTMAIWCAVDHGRVGVIYDPVNLERLGQEVFPASLTLQREAIRHVHVKDDERIGGERRACVPGRGIVPWPAILVALAASGYAGALTLEYETRWLPHLPAPEIGLPEALRFLRGCAGQAVATEGAVSSQA